MELLKFILQKLDLKYQPQPQPQLLNFVNLLTQGWQIFQKRVQDENLEWFGISVFILLKFGLDKFKESCPSSSQSYISGPRCLSFGFRWELWISVTFWWPWLETTGFFPENVIHLRIKLTKQSLISITRQDRPRPLPPPCHAKAVPVKKGTGRQWV